MSNVQYAVFFYLLVCVLLFYFIELLYIGLTRIRRHLRVACVFVAGMSNALCLWLYRVPESTFRDRLTSSEQNKAGASPQQEEVKLCRHSFLEDLLTHRSFLYLSGLGCVDLLPILSSVIYLFILFSLVLFYFVYACCLAFKRAPWRRPAGGIKHDIIHVGASSVVLLRRVL